MNFQYIKQNYFTIDKFQIKIQHSVFCFLTVIKSSQYKLHIKDKTLSLILGTREQQYIPTRSLPAAHEAGQRGDTPFLHQCYL